LDTKAAASLIRVQPCGLDRAQQEGEEGEEGEEGGKRRAVERGGATSRHCWKRASARAYCLRESSRQMPPRLHSESACFGFIASDLPPSPHISYHTPALARLGWQALAKAEARRGAPKRELPTPTCRRVACALAASAARTC